MDSQPAAPGQSFCDVAGCTDRATTSRWAMVGGVNRHIEVCWKHEEGDIQPEMLEPAQEG